MAFFARDRKKQKQFSLFDKEYKVYYKPVTHVDAYKCRWRSFPKDQVGFGNNMSRKSIQKLTIPFLKKKNLKCK